MKDAFKKIKTYIIAHKVPTIVVSAVLAVAIVTGVTVGVINHSKIVEDADAFGTESSLDSNSKTTISVPPIEDNSSVESTSSEESTSSTSETIETTSTPSKEDTVSSKTTSSKSSVSTSSKTASSKSGSSTSSKTNTATSSKSNSSTSSASTSSKWVCPDPSAHPQKSADVCLSQSIHKDYIAQYKRQEEEKNNPSSRNPADVGVKCWICGKPYGDGYNGTCHNYFDKELGRFACHYYD